MGSPEFASDAWLLQGMTVSIPGWLELRDGRLRFVQPDETVFDIAIDDISTIDYPWYYFGGGLKLSAGERRFRLSFVKPNGVETAVGRGLGEAGNPAGLLVAVSKVFDVQSGKKVGRRWRELLPARS